MAEIAEAADRESSIIARAVEDSDFRVRLLADPMGVIEGELGAAIPEGVAVNVHEESSTAVHIVLPASDQLVRDELDAIVGAHRGGASSGWDSYTHEINQRYRSSWR
jgi:hypothetical protein